MLNRSRCAALVIKIGTILAHVCLFRLHRVKVEDNDIHCFWSALAQLQNGRWAMLGFLAALIVEAATGRGIIGQVFLYLRASGLLGEASGF